MKWFVGFIVAFGILIGGWSVDRAWKQVRDLELASSPTVGVGSSPRIDVVTSGRAPVTVVLTLAQGTRTDTIAVQTIGAHRDAFWDPTFISRRFYPRLTTTQMSRFEAGAAVLRAEARGRPQWLREPPPVVREVAVTLAAR